MCITLYTSVRLWLGPLSPLLHATLLRKYVLVGAQSERSQPVHFSNPEVSEEAFFYAPN